MLTQFLITILITIDYQTTYNITAEEFDEIVRSKTIETGSKFILTDLQRAGQCQNALRDLSGVDVIVIGGHVANCIFFDELLSEGRIIREKNEYEADSKFNSDGFNLESPICMIFSSGTSTGAPKCIVHTQKSFNNFAVYHRYYRKAYRFRLFFNIT